MNKFLMIVIMLFTISLIGCQTNPTTGQWEISPGASEKIDSITIPAEENIDSLTAMATAIWPPAAGILGLIGIGLGAWNKRSANNSYGLTECLVTAIDKWKEKNPDNWDGLEAEFDKLIGPDAENVIRAIRKLPAKV